MVQRIQKSSSGNSSRSSSTKEARERAYINTAIHKKSCIIVNIRQLASETKEKKNTLEIKKNIQAKKTEWAKQEREPEWLGNHIIMSTLLDVHTYRNATVGFNTRQFQLIFFSLLCAPKLSNGFFRVTSGATRWARENYIRLTDDEIFLSAYINDSALVDRFIIMNQVYISSQSIHFFYWLRFSIKWY